MVAGKLVGLRLAFACRDEGPALNTASER